MRHLSHVVDAEGASSARARSATKVAHVNRLAIAWRAAPARTTHARINETGDFVGRLLQFHYKRDSWRVQQVLKMGALEGQPLLSGQDWEQVKRKGNAAIEKWISDQMAYKTAVVVLVGAETASRPWVRYEIAKAWDEKRPLVGVRINGLADSNGYTDSAGDNPFERVTLRGGGTTALYVPVFTPAGSTSQQVHASIAASLTTWVGSAYKRS